MFVAHFAVAFAAKRAARRTSLGTLTAAAQLLDLIWAFLVLAGVEQVKIQPGITAASPMNFIVVPQFANGDSCGPGSTGPSRSTGAARW